MINESNPVRTPKPRDERPIAQDFTTVGEYAEALVEYLVRKEFERRDAEEKRREDDAEMLRMIERGML